MKKCILGLAMMALTSGMALSNTAQENWDEEILGYEVGNGGDAVVCRMTYGNRCQGGDIRSAELLDFYENRVFGRIKYKIDLGGPELSVKDKVKYALNRLTMLSPERKKKFLARLAQFEQNSNRVACIDLEDISDSGHLGVPAGCKVEQLVVLRTDADPDLEYKYTINQNIWDKLDKDNQAGAILHEIIYEESLAQNHKNSIPTRKFTAFLASKDFEENTLESYFQFLQKIHYNESDYLGLPFDVSSKLTEYYGPFTLAAGELTQPSQVKIGKQKLWMGVIYGNKKDDVGCPDLKSASYIKLWPSGSVHYGLLNGAQPFKVGDKKIVLGNDHGQFDGETGCGNNHDTSNFDWQGFGNFTTVPTYFDEEGNLMASSLGDNQYFKVGGELKLFSSDFMSRFYKNGQLRLGHSNCTEIEVPGEYRGCYFKAEDGSEIFVRQYTRLKFNEKGLVVK